MRPRDVHDYLALRRLSKNALETLRFRKRQRAGQLLHVQLRDGAELEIRAERADYHMFHRIFLADEYRLTSLARRSLGTVIDLGGNVGLFAARAATLARRVVAYEPVAANFAQLLTNVARYPNVEAIPKAVGPAGRIRIYHPRIPELSGVYSSFRENGGHMSDRYDEVDAVPLGEILEQHAIDRCTLLKIDVEGQEYDILYGASRDVLARVDNIHAEYHDVARDDPKSRVDALVGYLADHGYQTELVPHRRKPNHGMLFASRAAATS